MVYRRKGNIFSSSVLYISLCRIKFLPSQGLAVQQKEQTVIHTRDFFIVINTWMISLTQSEANLLYPSSKIGSLGVDFSEKLKEKVLCNTQPKN